MSECFYFAMFFIDIIISCPMAFNTQTRAFTGINFFADLFFQFWFEWFQIITSFTSVVHQRAKTFIIDIDQLVFGTLDNWTFHVVCRWANIFVLLTIEDIKGDQMNFGVSVLSGFGSGHIDDLACLSLDHNELIFTKGRALLWVGKGGSGS